MANAIAAAFRGSPWSAAGCLLMLAALAFNLVEALDDTLYTRWARQNIHLFTPLVPAALLLIGQLRGESRRFLWLGVLQGLLHYGLLKFLHDLGRAGAAVFRQL